MDNLSQVGIGGILALLVLREVFGFLRTKNGKKHDDNSSGSKAVEFWQTEIRTAVTDAIAPYLMQQTDALRGIQATEQKIHEAVLELVLLARQPAARADRARR